MKLRLDARWGGRDRSWVLPEGESVLGRDPGCALHVDDPTLSRRHAAFRREGERVFVRDLGSTNGVERGGGLVEGEAELRPGAALRCGNVELLLREEGSAPELAAPLRTVDPTTLRDGGEDPGRLRMLLELSRLLARPDRVDSLPARGLDELARLLPVGRVAVLLLQADGSLQAVATHGHEGQGLPYSRSIVRAVLEAGRAALYGDVRAVEGIGDAASVMAADIRSTMCAPLLADDECLGALYVDHSVHTQLYREEDLELLAAFASQVAVALRHERLQGELREASAREASLRRFFAPAVAQEIAARPELLGEAREAEVALLFTDIVDYTGLGSRLHPLELTRLLQLYFPPMAEEVFAREGTLEKYIGDALLAAWGVPRPVPDAVDRAVAAGRAMLAQLPALNQALAAEGLPAVGLRLGVHRGPVAFANVGSRDYLQVATVGDTTSVAARVCAAARPGELWLSDEARGSLRQLPGELRDEGPRDLKGVAGRPRLYSLPGF